MTTQDIKKWAREEFTKKFIHTYKVWDSFGDCKNLKLEKEHLDFIDSIIDKAVQEKKVDENTSDGYHTFKELYEFRKIYNTCLFNEWARQGKYSVHKSKKHSDGKLCFGGDFFVVVATLPNGDISNHYEIKDWDLFECEEREMAKEWDGHTAQDVVVRLLSLITNKSDINKVTE